MSLYNVARILAGGLCHLIFRIRIEGRENIPFGGNFVVCANHKSMWDPVSLAIALPIRLCFMAKEELFKNKLLGSLFRAVGAFPVKRGTGDIGALKLAIKLLSGGENLLIFPEGTRSPKGHMGSGKSGAALIAIKSQKSILPIGVCGSYKLFSKITIRIGKPIELDEYFGKKNDSEALQYITDQRIMKTLSELSEVPVYEDRDCK